MRVEFEPLGTDRHREVEHSARLENPLQLGNRFSPAVWINRVPISTESDVLDDMKSG